MTSPMQSTNGEARLQRFLTLTIGPSLKAEIDDYLEYARLTARIELDRAEAATQMLWHFVETNDEFVAQESRAGTDAKSSGKEQVA